MPAKHVSPTLHALPVNSPNSPDETEGVLRELKLVAEVEPEQRRVGVALLRGHFRKQHETC